MLLPQLTSSIPQAQYQTMPPLAWKSAVEKSIVTSWNMLDVWRLLGYSFGLPYKPLHTFPPAASHLTEMFVISIDVSWSQCKRVLLQMTSRTEN